MEPRFTPEEVELLKGYVGREVIFRTESSIYEFGKRIDNGSGVFCCMQNATQHRPHVLVDVTPESIFLKYGEDVRECPNLSRVKSNRCSFLFGRDLECERLEFITEIEVDRQVIFRRSCNYLPEDVLKRCESSERINIYGED